MNTESPKAQVQFVTIDEDNLGQRIDNYLLAKLKGVPKSMIYRIVRKGEVRVNKKRIKPEYKLQDGDIVNLDVSAYLNGFHGDNSKTYAVGDVDDAGIVLMEGTKEALMEGKSSGLS